MYSTVETVLYMFYEAILNRSVISYQSKRYVFFTDASDQVAAAILTQEYTREDRDTKEMPTAYLSAQFSDTQFKWSTVGEGRVRNILCNQKVETLS